MTRQVVQIQTCHVRPPPHCRFFRLITQEAQRCVPKTKSLMVLPYPVLCCAGLRKFSNANPPPPPLSSTLRVAITKYHHIIKVLGFESRHILRLADVQSITLLGTALDLSSSLVIATNSGGVPGELMLVFPGQKVRQVQPLEVFLRQLVVLAVKEKRAAAATAAAAAASVAAVTLEGSPHDGEDPALTGVCV